MHNGLRI